MNKSEGVRDCIKFNHEVRDVNFSDETKKFTVSVRDWPNKNNFSEQFDYVFVCSGHFSTPNLPHFPGFEKFEGRIVHSHDFRDACEFKGKDVLILGTSYSAEDVASQCYKYGAKTLTMSWRTNPLPYNWPENFTTVPLLESCSGTECKFIDGTVKHIDAIILCTGYQHYYPFMSDDLCLKTINRLWPESLLKGVFWPTNNKLMYIGMQNQFFTFPMFDAQAWLARDVILGKLILESPEELQEEFQTWRDKESKLTTAEEMVRFQASYIEYLTSLTDYPNTKMDNIIQNFLDWMANKTNDIMGFRDCPHISQLTGEKASIHHTKWLDAMDDSLECFLNR